MADKPSFGILPGSPSSLGKPDADLRFRIAVLGNFSGQAGRAAKPGKALVDRRAVPVKYEDLDDILARMGVVVRIPLDGKTSLAIPIASLDDFHPDQVFGNVDRFDDLADEDEQGELMQTVLHHADFQAVESAWRGLEWLLKRVSKGGRVEIVLYDVSRAEFATDLCGAEDLSKSALYRLLIEKGAEGPSGLPWGVLLGLYSFTTTRSDADLLGRVAKLAARAGAPFLTGAEAAFLKTPPEKSTPDGATWASLRALPEAVWLGLAWPRFLLRLPYGANTLSIDRFAFEEFGNHSARQPYLWGHAAYACAALLGQAFQQQGWAMKPGAVLDLDSMPMHVGVDEDGDPLAILAEAWLDRPRTDQLARQGVMPFLCVRGRDALQLLRFQSLAQPPKDKPFLELCGRWNPGGVPASVAAAAPDVKVGIGMPPSTPAIPPTAFPPPQAAAVAVASPPAAVESPPDPVESPPAEVDAELAALLADLNSPPPAGPGPQPPAVSPQPPAEDTMDAELAALLRELDAPTMPKKNEG
jgi:hypothetical protein